MKKFFKALALVLALTLVIGTIPVAAAKTAQFKMKKTTKILYIGGSQGEKEDGTKCKTLNKFTVTKWLEGFDADTMDLKIKTADKTIASKNNKYDRVYAKGIGTVKVKLYIYENGRQIGSVENFKVKVKKNVDVTDADAVKIKLGTVKDAQKVLERGYFVDAEDAEWFDEVPAKLGVNFPYIVRLTRKDADGKYTDTDLRNLVCLDKDGNADADVEIVKVSNTLFYVTFKAGKDVKLTAQAYQSGKFNKVLASKDIELHVGYTLMAATQESLDTIRATFSTPVTKVDAKNFRLYSVVNGKEVAFTKVAKVENVADDPTSVNVTFYRNFAEGEKYYLEYEGDKETTVEIQTIKVDSDSVAYVEVPDMVVEENNWTTFSFKARTKEGVDVTESSIIQKKGKFEFTISDKGNGADINSDKKQIKITKADGKEYTLSVNYKWTSDKDGAKRELPTPGTGKVTAVEAKAWEIGEVEAILTASNAADAWTLEENGTKAKRNDKVEALKIDDTVAFALGDSVKVQILVPYSRTNVGTGKVQNLYQTKINTAYNDQKVTSTYADYEAGRKVLYSKYELASSNKDIVMIGSNNTLIANKVGEATILIYGVNKDSKEVIGTLDIVIKDKRKASTFNVTIKDEKRGINKNLAGDTITFNLDLKDQYGKTFAGSFKVSNNNPNGDKTLATLVGTAKNPLTTTGTAITFTTDNVNLPTEKTEGQTNFVANLKFEVVGTSLAVDTVALNVSTDMTAKSYELSLSKDKLSTNFTKDTVQDSLTLTLKGVNADNFAVSNAAISFTSVTPSGEAKATKSEEGQFFYTVFRDGTQIKAHDDNFVGNTFYNITANATGTAINASGSSVVVKKANKLKAGTYEIKVYQITEVKDGYVSDYKIWDTKTFTVVDDQTALTAVKQKDLATITETKLLTEALTIKLGGADVPAGQFAPRMNKDDWNIASDAKSAYVYTVRYTIENKKEYANDQKTIKNPLYGATFEVTASAEALVETK